VTPAETLAKAKELDGFLGTAVRALKKPDQAAMNKFAELAARSATIRKDLDERADRLGKRLDAIPTLADATLGKHERLLDETESGINALEESLRDMIGHNGAPEKAEGATLEDMKTSDVLPGPGFVAPEGDAA
jgi:hypothetical protein